MPRQDRLALVALCSMAVVTPSVAVRAAPPDAGYYTAYSFTPKGYVNTINCGTSHFGFACLSGSTLGVFGRAGCIIEGVAIVNGNTVTRAVYIVDVNAGTTGNGVKLFRYLKTDVIDPTNGYDDQSLGSSSNWDVELPLVGNANATCVVAGTSDFLFIGTNQTSSIARVQKGSLVVDVIDGPQASQIKYITADQYGYVSVGYFSPGSNTESKKIFAPNGQALDDVHFPDAYLLTPYAGVSNTPGSP